MPFFTYEVVQEATGAKVAQNPRGVRLAGNSGPFRRHAQPLFASAANEILTWHVDEAGILNLLGFTLGNHALIIDLKPDAPDEVSLYRLRHVWGRSDAWWTPLALQLEVLFADHAVENVLAFKNRFDLPAGPGELVHEFLYLRGGLTQGDWMWGRNGTVNATLLSRDTFLWFSDQIAPFLR